MGDKINCQNTSCWYYLNRIFWVRWKVTLNLKSKFLLLIFFAKILFWLHPECIFPHSLMWTPKSIIHTSLLLLLFLPVHILPAHISILVCLFEHFHMAARDFCQKTRAFYSFSDCDGSALWNIKWMPKVAHWIWTLLWIWFLNLPGISTVGTRFFLQITVVQSWFYLAQVINTPFGFT